MVRMPILVDLGIKRVVHATISHPPDVNLSIGPVLDVKTTMANLARVSYRSRGCKSQRKEHRPTVTHWFAIP